MCSPPPDAGVNEEGRALSSFGAPPFEPQTRSCMFTQPFRFTLTRFVHVARIFSMADFPAVE